MKKYKAIFFDLDHTLWDFELNSIEALKELYNIHNLYSLGIPDEESFIITYKNINKVMWDLYSMNKISKQVLRNNRFNKTLEHFKILDDTLSSQLSDQYLEICPKKTNLFPHTIEILDYLTDDYELHIITNGFKEVQYKKIRNSGLDKFFQHIHISEEIGFKKPEPEIFHHAVKKSLTTHESCIMIGDNTDTDIAGAINAGIDHILFNPLKAKAPDHVIKEISELKDLKSLL